MTAAEARTIAEKFEEKSVHSEEEEFMFIEALQFLIDTEHDPRYMMWLGGHYYGKREFDLALKYYEMAKAMDYDDAYECLGYIWYYGRTGEKDYKKAYECFSRMMDKGNAVAAYKVADMYKNGYYVEKDYDKYVEIIEDLYENRVTSFRSLFDPFPEISTRLAGIRKKQGRIEDAIDLYVIAKDYLAMRISCSDFFGNLNIMKWLIDDLYELTDFDYEEFDLFDLYYLLKSPHVIKFDYEDTIYIIESQDEDGMCTVHFNDKWYRDRDEFFKNAVIADSKLTELYNELYGWEVLE